MSSTRRSLALSAIDSYLGLALQIASTVIVARILKPSEIGTFAVAAVFASLASNFRDFGVAEYLIQEKQCDDDAIRAALTVNICISWLMAVLLFGLSPIASDFYRTQGVGEVMRVQAVNFLLIPFGAVTMAWFRRELNFRPILLANVVSSVLSFGTTIALALAGFGYMSLAWGSFANIASNVLMSMFLRPADFPRWPGMRGVRRVIDFGKFASGIYLFGQAAKGAPEMIIGRILDVTAVANFSRGAGLVELFNRLVLRSSMAVCLPYFARGVRETGTPKPGMVTAMAYLTGIGWPFLGFMAACAYGVIRLMYGQQWMAAVPLAQLVCLSAVVDLMYHPTKEALLSLGKVRESATLQLVFVSLRIIGLLGVIPFGLTGACWGLVITSPIAAWVSHRALSKAIGFTWRDSLHAVKPSLITTAVSVGPFAAWCAFFPIGEGNYIATTVAGGLVCVVLWVLAVRMSQHAIWPEVQKLTQAVGRRLGAR